MGARLCSLALNDPSLELVAALDRDTPDLIGRPSIPGDALGPQVRGISSVPPEFKAHVVVDFSSDEGARAALPLAQRTGAALLVGTTALSSATVDALRRASTSMAVLVAPNTSRGVAVTAAAVESITQLLGGRAQISIVEAHHKAKKDAPSGTALRLAEAARAGGNPVENAQILSVRGGDVIGEHTVRFASDGEYIEITHRATSRDLFARGALDAATWLARRGPGWWTMNDVLGLPAR